MTNTIIQEIQNKGVKKVPVLEPGMTVRVHQKIKEGEKERIQIFEGLIIKISHGYGVDKTFTVRKVVEGIGVEKVFPIHSPNIAKIEIKKKSKIRRSKLYYMRERFGKSARLKGRFLTGQEKEMEEEAEKLAEKVEEEESKKEDAEESTGTEEAPAESPAEVDSPTEAAPEAPAETPTEVDTSAEAESETPAEEPSPAEAPEEAPAETPTEEPTPEEKTKEEA